MQAPTLSYTIAMTALVTPMRDDKVDFEAFERLLDHQIQAGIKSVVVHGCTGEVHLLEEEEKEELTKRALRRKELEVWLGCVEPSTKKAKRLLEKAKALNIRGHLLLSPCGIKPTQADLLHHFQSLMDTSSVPCIIYNNAPRCGVNISESTLIELANHERFYGVKECDNHPSRVQRISQRLGSHQWMICGDDNQLPGVLMAGTRGIISSASNAVPGLLLELLHHFEEDNLNEFASDCQQWLEVCNLLDALGNPRGIKALLSLMGKMACEMRSPLIQATPEQLDQLKRLTEQHRELFQTLPSLC